MLIQQSGPGGVVTGDFNGDGIPDIADVTGAGQTQGQGIEIRLGVGGGRFAPPSQTIPGTWTGGWPVAAVDLNGDGLSDLVLNGAAWLSNGDGTFRGPSASLQFCIATGDFNRDGKVDLVVVNPGDGIQFGNGDGTFLSPVPGPTNDAVGGVSVADIDGDGWPDLLLPTAQGAETWINQHDGGFAVGPPWNLPTRDFIDDITGPDLNGDGKADLVTFSRRSELNLWLQTADGGLALSASFATTGQPFGAGGAKPPALFTPDLNGDGLPDIVAAAASDGLTQAIVVLSGPDGGYSQPQTYYVGRGDYFTGPFMFVGDLDLDGHADIGIVSPYSDELTLIRNRGDGTFLGPNSLWPIPSAVGDWDGDGASDFIQTNSAGTWVYYGSQDGGLYLGTSCDAGVDGPTLADVDLDGRPDLVGFAGPTLVVGLNPGSRDQCPVIRSQGYVGSGPTLVADFDGDGRRGLAVITGSSGTITFFAGDADSGFQLERVFGTSFGAVNGVAADLDRDGRAELVLQNYTQPPSVLYRVDGGALLEVTLSGASAPYPGGELGVAVGDLNGDQYPDIVVTGTMGLLVYLNDGRGRFGSPVSYMTPPFGGQDGSSGLRLADIDGDGALDLVVSVPSSGLVTLRNRGDGTFEQAIARGPGLLPLIGDFNGDGRPDLLSNPAPGFYWTILLINSCQP